MNKIEASGFSASDAALPSNSAFVAEAGGPSLAVKLLQYLRRWKWLILGIAAASMIVGLVLTLLMVPQYSASAEMEIRRENFRITSVQGVEPEAQGIDLEFYQTQYGLLQTRSMAEAVVRALKLENDVVFLETFGADETVAEIKAGGLQATSTAARAERVRVAGDILLAHLTVVPSRLSRLVTVRFTSPSPELSQRVANTWTRVFIETTLERKFEATSYARRFLEERLEQLRRRLEDSERLLVTYASSQGIINLPVPTSGGDGKSTMDKPIVAENLEVLNRELSTGIADRIKAESRLRSAGGSTAESLASQGINTLRARRAELAAEYSKLLTQFEPEYVPARGLAAQIAQIDRALGGEEARIQSTLRATYDAARAREVELTRQVNGLKASLLDVRGRSIQYNIYQREVDTNRQLYDGLLQRYKEIGIAGGVGVNNISIVDPADLPQRPSSPNLVVNLLIALLGGVGLGIAVALVLDQIDESISDPRSVESTFGVPLLGIIPKVESDEIRVELLDRKSALAEAYLSAQTSLSFATSHGTPRSIAVTSTRAAEGKSSTSLALAHSLARAGRRVVLVDADMRSPSVHDLLEVPNHAGLSNYLAGSDDLSALVHHIDEYGIAAMTAGPPPPNAAELLSSDRLGKLLSELSERFDHVIIDVPPVMGLADAPLVARATESTVFVVQSHATGTSAARVAIRRLIDANANLVGILLTKFQIERAHYGAGYEYGYGYGYGYSARETRAPEPVSRDRHTDSVSGPPATRDDARN